MEIFGFAITFFSIVLTFLAWKNERWMKGAMEGMKEAVNGQTKLLEKMDERTQKMDEMAEQRHREIVELLKKGFGDLSRDVRELKPG
jgi:hypothetical protein